MTLIDQSIKRKLNDNIITSNNYLSSINNIEQNEPMPITVQRKINHGIVNYREGYYMDIHHFVRSGWEHNIARILQYCQLDYDYECYKFSLSDGTTYTPDFYVHIDDTFYEIKGIIDELSRHKIELFRKDYPDKKLIVIYDTIYYELLKQFPNINFKKHVAVYNTPYYTYNYIEYRHDQIQYEEWELDYKYYTNKRYNIDIQDCYSRNEVMDMLWLSYQQIYKSCIDGSIPYIKIDNNYFFPKNEIDLLVNRGIKYNKQLPIKPGFVKKCKECNCTFHTFDFNQQYCSKKCCSINTYARHRRQHIYVCKQCNKQYKNVYSMKLENLSLCPNCFRKNNNGKYFSTQLIHYHWYPGNIHNSFYNEAEDNFAKVLEYLNNEYTYQDNIYIIGQKSWYKYHFFRKKNNTLYIIHFACTHTVINNYRIFIKNNPNIKVHIITNKQYQRIMQFFRNKIDLLMNNYYFPIDHSCLVCKKTFTALPYHLYCCQKCKEYAKEQRRRIRTKGHL